MTEKTYGAYGLIEYEMTLSIGQQQVRASFTGGSQSQYGVVPATYTTANPIVQDAIEHSRAWVKGRIRLVSSVEKDGVAPGGVVANSLATGRAAARDTEPADAGAPLGADAPRTVAPGRDSVASTDGGAGASEGPTEVSVACIEDAIEHLRTLGYKPAKLTTQQAVDAAAAKEGIHFVYNED